MGIQPLTPPCIVDTLYRTPFQSCLDSLHVHLVAHTLFCPNIFLRLQSRTALGMQRLHQTNVMQPDATSLSSRTQTSAVSSRPKRWCPPLTLQSRECCTTGCKQMCARPPCLFRTTSQPKSQMGSGQGLSHSLFTKRTLDARKEPQDV